MKSLVHVAENEIVFSVEVGVLHHLLLTSGARLPEEQVGHQHVQVLLSDGGVPRQLQ